MFSFEKLEVYKKALLFSKEVLVASTKWPTIYKYNLVDQLIRASLSISLNIAEGSSKSSRDFKRYLSIARGSSYECIPLIQVAMEVNLITGNQYNLWYNQLVTIAKMLSGLKSSIKVTK